MIASVVARVSVESLVRRLESTIIAEAEFGVSPWDSDNPKVRQLWDELTVPENRPEIERRMQECAPLNRRAQEFFQRACDACLELGETSSPRTDRKAFQLHGKDTGSADVQIARLTERITHLTAHLQIHKKDFSTRRGLLMLVARRRSLLNYLQRTANDRYKGALAKLGLRK